MIEIEYRSKMNIDEYKYRSMFQDRMSIFKEKLGWNLDVDKLGREMDEYDELDPLYIILRDDRGEHIGSTRLLPTTGRTMIAEKFPRLTDGVAIESASIWEVSRFFVSPRSKNRRRDAARIMHAGCSIGLRAGIGFYVGVTAVNMVPVFRMCGWPGEVIGEQQSGDGAICACLWEVSEQAQDRLNRRAQLQDFDLDVSASDPHAGATFDHAIAA